MQHEEAETDPIILTTKLIYYNKKFQNKEEKLAIYHWEQPEIHFLCRNTLCDRHTLVAVRYKKWLLKCVCVSSQICVQKRN